MGRPRKNPLEVKEVKAHDIKEPSLPVKGIEALLGCVGSPALVNKYITALDRLVKDYGFDGAEFDRQFRAFRLYKGEGNHVDWAGLDDLNVKYELGLPSVASGALKYQPPHKRHYYMGK